MHIEQPVQNLQLALFRIGRLIQRTIQFLDVKVW